MVHRYKIVDSEGNPVMVDKIRTEYVYVGGPGVPTAAQLPPVSASVKPYRTDMDFSTNWLADRVEEGVTKKKVVERTFDPGTGSFKEKPVDKEEYRYFLHMVDKNDKELQTAVELERESYEKSLIR